MNKTRIFFLRQDHKEKGNRYHQHGKNKGIDEGLCFIGQVTCNRGSKNSTDPVKQGPKPTIVPIMFSLK